jgi:hypothetical protein
MQPNLLNPGLHFIGIAHDDFCPTIESQSVNDCTCSEIHINESSEQAWVKSRKERRQAQREAERAKA